jgi:uncharacterized protein YdhG (YjbR/CyaY superfamily)
MTFTSVDEYIAAQAPMVQVRLRELRAIVREAVPQAAEVISYGLPTYRLGRRIVSFGAAKRHCGLYGAALEAEPEELRGFQTGKGTVRFPLDAPIPAELVRKLVRAKLDGAT